LIEGNIQLDFKLDKSTRSSSEESKAKGNNFNIAIPNHEIEIKTNNIGNSPPKEQSLVIQVLNSANRSSLNYPIFQGKTKNKQIDKLSKKTTTATQPKDKKFIPRDKSPSKTRTPEISSPSFNLSAFEIDKTNIQIHTSINQREKELPLIQKKCQTRFQA
jgi:hypothetical protein